MKRKVIGKIYYYEGDSEFQFDLDPEFLKDKHPVLITDWMDDLISQAKQEREQQILETQFLIDKPQEYKDL